MESGTGEKNGINITGTNWQNWNINCSLGNSRVSMLNCLNFILLLERMFLFLGNSLKY